MNLQQFKLKDANQKKERRNSVSEINLDDQRESPQKNEIIFNIHKQLLLDFHKDFDWEAEQQTLTPVVKKSDEAFVVVEVKPQTQSTPNRNQSKLVANIDNFRQSLITPNSISRFLKKQNKINPMDVQPSNQEMQFRNMEIKNSIERRPTRVRKTLVNGLSNVKEPQINKLLEAIEEEGVPEESFNLEDEEDDDDSREQKVQSKVIQKKTRSTIDGAD